MDRKVNLGKSQGPVRAWMLDNPAVHVSSFCRSTAATSSSGMNTGEQGHENSLIQHGVRVECRYSRYSSILLLKYVQVISQVTCNVSEMRVLVCFLLCFFVPSCFQDTVCLLSQWQPQRFNGNFPCGFFQISKTSKKQVTFQTDRRFFVSR